MPRENRMLVSNHAKANNKNSTNSIFNVPLDNPIRIPINAKNVIIYCVNANIVNFFYNISAALNNNIIYYTDDVALPQKYTITFPDGAYDFVHINQHVRAHLIQAGLDIATIKFYSQEYTQKVSVALKNGYGIRFPAGIAAIFGYAANATYFNNTGVTYYYDAPDPAKFNNIISLLLNCSICQSGFYNGESTNLLAPIPINARVGSKIDYNPLSPIKIDANHLIGSTIDNISVELRDQLRRQITVSEDWNVAISIEWDNE